MTQENFESGKLILLGCGKMGSAMLKGWLAKGVNPKNIWVDDPYPSTWVMSTGVNVNEELPSKPAFICIAIKPQMISQILPKFSHYGNGHCVFISIAAGVKISSFESILGPKTPIIRAMPNTPAEIGFGVTAKIANNNVSENAIERAEKLLSAIGEVVSLTSEGQMDAVTGLSGSGPAYVFYLIDALAAAGHKQGLEKELAMKLAKMTVLGGAKLAAEPSAVPEVLRVNVTSPNGTTEAGLKILMHTENGLAPLIEKTVAAATERSEELANG